MFQRFRKNKNTANSRGKTQLGVELTLLNERGHESALLEDSSISDDRPSNNQTDFVETVAASADLPAVTLESRNQEQMSDIVSLKTEAPKVTTQSFEAMLQRSEKLRQEFLLRDLEALAAERALSQERELQQLNRTKDAEVRKLQAQLTALVSRLDEQEKKFDRAIAALNEKVSSQRREQQSKRVEGNPFVGGRSVGNTFASALVINAATDAFADPEFLEDISLED